MISFSDFFFFFQAEDGIRDAQESRGLGDVYKRQDLRQGRSSRSSARLAVHQGTQCQSQKASTHIRFDAVFTASAKLVLPAFTVIYRIAVSGQPWFHTKIRSSELTYKIIYICY
eukprot:TRINITY_DN7775_c0_g1_i2.p1 TRINITY_DN7775_c0_g1~~TRINITY_DN7775_c0_g1_i2.p1  ORF type:complete len:114 (+),score=5.83 TRINITY_DN7775_c0_g1_i2:61-402(+)